MDWGLCVECLLGAMISFALSTISLCAWLVSSCAFFCFVSYKNLGTLQVVQQKVLPLLLANHTDEKLAFQVAKLLVMLTLPVEEVIGRRLENRILVDYADAIARDGAVVNIFVSQVCSLTVSKDVRECRGHVLAIAWQLIFACACLLFVSSVASGSEPASDRKVNTHNGIGANAVP